MCEALEFAPREILDAARSKAAILLSCSSALSPTASQGLNEMLRDHDFGEGPSFLENVIQSLTLMGKLTANHARLRRQLEAISFEARQSLSVRIRVIRAA